MSTGKMRQLKVNLPEEVAQFYQDRARHYGIAVQAVTAPVLCAMARGEIKQEFTKQPGAEFRP
jgi:PIN domain nuclease of toxin-antitoxin system